MKDAGSIAFHNSQHEPLPPPQPLPIGGIEGRLFSSGNPFVSSPLLDIRSVVEMPPHGVLAVVPAVNVLAVFPIVTNESTL